MAFRSTHRKNAAERRACFPDPDIDRDRVVWTRIIDAVRPLLPGDIEVIESPVSREFGHLTSGLAITMTLGRGETLVWSRCGGSREFYEHADLIGRTIALVTRGSALWIDVPGRSRGTIDSAMLISDPAMVATLTSEFAELGPRTDLTLA